MRSGREHDSATGTPLGAGLEENLAALTARLGPCGDVVFRRFTAGSQPLVEAAIVYCSSLTSAQVLSEGVLEPLMVRFPRLPAEGTRDLCAMVRQAGLPVGDPDRCRTLEDLTRSVFSGSAVVMIEGCREAISVQINAPHLNRQVSESKSEGAVRGPRDAFVETLHVNLGLLRRRLPVADFRVEVRHIGTRTQTEVAVVYLEGLPKPGVVDEVRERLDRIKIDGVLESAYLEEFIEDSPWSPFPTVEHTERPDKVVAALLEGRVAILTANTPVCLVVPVSFMQFLQAAEDYYERFIYSAPLRLLRYVALLIALTLPSIWVAVTTYHHEMIPSALFIALAASREGVPWPAVIEAILMEVAFEFLREAGLRMPRPVGQAISIIGGLVIGESAIRANIASPGMVIVVALTGIASFAVPAYNFAIALRLLRFPLMVMAATLGLHGVVVGLMLMLVHLAGLRSFGVPYLSPFTPPQRSDWKDTVVRAPFWFMRRRPAILSALDRQRTAPGQMPGRRGS